MKHILIILLSISSLAAGEVEYFPPDENISSRAAIILSLTDEPSLALIKNTKDLQCLRLTYIPTFGNPFMVRLTKKEKVTHLKYSTLNGKGGYDMGRVAEHREENKTGSSIVDEIFDKADEYFNTKDEQVKGTGLDGSRWILEYVDKHGYQVSDLWSPNNYEENKSFVITCRWLCELAGLSLSHDNNVHLLDPLIEEEFQELKKSKLYLIVNQEPTDIGPTDPFAE